MAKKPAQSNTKIALLIDPDTAKVIDSLAIPVTRLAAKVRYLMTRGIETVQAEKAARTK